MTKEQLLLWSQQAAQVEAMAESLAKKLLLRPDDQNLDYVSFAEPGVVIYNWTEYDYGSPYPYNDDHRFPIDMLLLEGPELERAIEDHKIDNEAHIAQRKVDRLKNISDHEEAKKQALLRELQRKYEKS